MGTAGVLSHDGTSLFYLLQGVEAQGEEPAKDGLLVRRNLRTGAEEELFRSPDLLARPFGIAPDGRHVLFAIGDSAQQETKWFAKEGAQLMLLDLATRNVRELTRVRGVGDVETVTWSDDGRYVLYPQYTDYRQDSKINTTTLWRVAVGGGEPEKVAETFQFRGAVSPDGRRIAYTTGGTRWGHMVMENLKAVLQH